jgi:hypothetical protein
MIKKTLLATAIALSSGAALAGAPASLTETRGYENCLQAAQEIYPSLKVAKDYYINEAPAARSYYLNGYAAHDGVWTEMRVSCETTASGLRLMTMNVEPGRYVGVRASATDIAQY